MVAGEQYIQGYALYRDPILPLRTKTISDLNPTIMYENRNGGSLLEKANLLKIEQLENTIKERTKWKMTCYAVSEFDSSCDPLKSFVSPLFFIYNLGIQERLYDEVYTLGDLTQE